jgi:hypothetical protein
MNFNAGESKSTTNDVRELTEAELQGVAGGWAGYVAYIMAKEQQRIEELYRDRI